MKKYEYDGGTLVVVEVGLAEPRKALCALNDKVQVHPSLDGVQKWCSVPAVLKSFVQPRKAVPTARRVGHGRKKRPTLQVSGLAKLRPYNHRRLKLFRQLQCFKPYQWHLLTSAGRLLQAMRNAVVSDTDRHAILEPY